MSLRSGRILWLLRVYSTRPILSHGYVLIEVLIALLIFGFIANSFMGAVYASRVATRVVDEQSAAESLTRTEMEYVKQTPYWSLGFEYEIPGNPPPWEGGRTSLDARYPGYTVAVTGYPIDPSTHQALPHGLDQGMQLIEVRVSRGGDSLLTTSTVKISR